MRQLQEVTLEGRSSMEGRGNFIVHFTEVTWEEFLRAGGKITGFRETQWPRLHKLTLGDRLLCYLVGKSSFVGVLRVSSLPFRDSSMIWKDEVFPCRIKVNVVVAVPSRAGVSVNSLRGRLSIFVGRRNSWVGHVRGPLLEWQSSDVDVVQESLIKASKDSKIIYG